MAGYPAAGWRPGRRRAVDAFERLGARPWTERARRELCACGPAAGPPGGDTERLTPQEHRVAVLVAEGAANREVASTLFLSQKTIEFHLRNVFRKLGLRSRAELARLVGAGRVLA